jgi:hypothetical protein
MRQQPYRCDRLNPNTGTPYNSGLVRPSGGVRLDGAMSGGEWGTGNREHDRTGLPELGNGPRPYLSLDSATSIELELYPVLESCG